MSNPVYPDLSGAEADALSGTTDAGTGIKHLHAAADDSTTPTHFQRMMQLEHDLFDMMARFGGAVIDKGGLNVGVFACVYEIAAAEKSFAGVASQALTASVTNYLYLDTDETLKIDTSTWPAGAHFRLAKVTTNGSDITALVDCRMQNFQRGGNAWYSIAAASDVDFGNFLAKNLAGIVLKAATTLTLSGDTITPTQEIHDVETQGGGAADDLVTLTADAAKVGRKVILRCLNASHVVTVKSTGNIALIDGDCVLDNTDKNIELLQDTTTTWVELGRNINSPKTLLFDVDANSKRIKNLLELELATATDLNIVSDAITPSKSAVTLVPESGIADNLSLINLPAEYGHKLLFLNGNEYTITVIDSFSAGGNNIYLATPGKNLVIQFTSQWLLLMCWNGAWYEISRSQWRLDQLVGTGDVLPWSPPLFKAGSLTNGDILFDGLLSFPLTIRSARGRVGTAPSGTSCVVDIQKNGASIFAADANAINIAAGATSDVSDTITATFAIGDRLKVYVKTASSAADLGVTLEAYMTAKAQ